MEEKEFFVPYIEGSLGVKTKQKLKQFILVVLGFIILGAVIFSFFQKPFVNSTFELSNITKITGTFHENPYPMLRVQIVKDVYKNIALLGFGKFSANPYLEELFAEERNLNGKKLSIEGNLIYYNGKTLLQITDQEKVTLEDGNGLIPKKQTISEVILEGEIIDPKCYFGVMKPGFGKIHRSCAVRCVSGGIPPVLATTYQNNISEYYLITDLEGHPINKAVLPFIGKPARIKGVVERFEDWYLFKIDPENISVVKNKSAIYSD